MGGWAVTEGVPQGRERAFQAVTGIASNRKRFLHYFGPVVADRAGGKLEPIAHYVVLEGQDFSRVLAFQSLQTPLRHGERVVREVPLVCLAVALEHREVDDPAESEQVGVGEAEVTTKGGPQLAERQAGRWTGPDAGQHGVAMRSAHGRDDGPDFLRGEPSGKRAFHLRAIRRQL